MLRDYYKIQRINIFVLRTVLLVTLVHRKICIFIQGFANKNNLQIKQIGNNKARYHGINYKRNKKKKQILIKKQIELKFRKKKKSLFQQLSQQQRKTCHQKQQDNDLLDKPRIKQRKIKDVIQKVAWWRRLYSGFKDQNGKIIHLSLKDAAEKVGISKKTLDDYLLQIRWGKKYGYNFDLNQNEKIGNLRAYVRDQKSKEEKNQKGKIN